MKVLEAIWLIGKAAGLFLLAIPCVFIVYVCGVVIWNIIFG